MAEIEQLTSVDQKACDEINALLRQFNDTQTSLDLLSALMQSKTTEVWVAREEGTIIGMMSLLLLLRMVSTTARIEDVVVDEAHRGKGLGRALCEKMIERAKARGAYSIQLNSRPARVAANALYKKLGFELRETNSYRMKL